MNIRRAAAPDLEAVMALRLALFPDEDNEPLARAMVARCLAGEENTGAWPQHIWLAEEGNAPIGYIEVSIRSVAEGCWEDGPVPFIEGWYVSDAAQGNGVGRALVDAVEGWARDAGYKAIASNAEVENVASIAAHLRLGFEDEGVTANFRKPL